MLLSRSTLVIERHFIKNAMPCVSDIQWWLTVATVSIDFVLIFSYSAIAAVSFKNRDIFHPFFSTLFSLFFLSYATSDVFEATALFMELLPNKDVTTYDVIFGISEFFYFYASPCAVCLLLERSVASRYPKDYETARPWKILWTSQLICLLVSSCVIYAGRWRIIMTDDVQKLILLALQIVIAMMLLFLLIYNRKRTRDSVGIGTKLGTRYQLSENIRVLKLLIPVIFLDVSITTADIISQIMHTTTLLNGVINCSTSSTAILVVVFKIISFLSQLLIPVTVIFFHPSFKRVVEFFTFNRVSPSVKRREQVIKNVLGMKINEGQSTDHYFSSLQKTWG
ncbi:hypothetical protein Y032_0169g223 [Ancylostoma ceylanicum]|uniref:G-protein coupled receptors family 1 profile domain-containing protein n=1 Tax=Ancylostoma ceylanicum TaxID=53326 RepID=A0A016SWD0_9BILA|nr:hypothetical protein Y032_0169g223 [Ancylostoma ceylanicum]